jgi:hypothetical protein
MASSSNYFVFSIFLIVDGYLLAVQTPPKSSYLIRPAGTFSKEKGIGNFSFFWGEDLKG